jgi:hypothetical protein
MSVEEFEEWSVWETTTGGVTVHTPASDDPEHIRCDCPGGAAMHENEVWAQEKAGEIRAAGGTAVVKRRTQTWITGPWVEPGPCLAENALSGRPPTAEECNTHAEVDGGWAFWWPQMGGYVARAIAKVVKCHVDVWVWHDGEFPFTGECHSCGLDRSPVHIHMDDGFEWVALGTFLNRLQDETSEKEAS